MKEFITFTNELNDYAKNYQGEKEIINEDDIIKAIYYLNNIYITDTGDVLTYLSALNLCNAYVKQPNSVISYSFKKSISKIIKILNGKPFKYIKACQTKDKGNLYIFKIGNVTFSFHDEKILEINSNYHENMTWDGIKKQPCAKTIFEKCIKNNLYTENKTVRGEDIRKSSKRILTYYHEKKLDFSKIMSSL